MDFELPFGLIEMLPDTFCKELQIWNILNENASFFELNDGL